MISRLINLNLVLCANIIFSYLSRCQLFNIIDAKWSFSLQKKIKKHFFYTAVLSISMNYNLPCCGNLAVKLKCIVLNLYVEGLFVAVEFKVGRHSPRVPAGAVSAKWHGTLSYLFAVGLCDEDPWYNLIITRFGTQSRQSDKANNQDNSSQC